MVEISRIIGLDLGSRRTKGVVLENGAVKEHSLFESWSIDREPISAWVESIKPHRIGATGYNRRLAQKKFNATVITEIRAFGLGTALLLPSTRTIIDIGGQDAKVIKVDEKGNPVDFEMNDRCAAGTGKFFEIAARTLGIPLVQLPQQALAATHSENISSTCAVFAESEIIGKLADGCNPLSLARGIYKSVAERILSMLQRVGITPPIILVGGGANSCLAIEISNSVGFPIEIPEMGIYFGATGIALFAEKENS